MRLQGIQARSGAGDLPPSDHRAVGFDPELLFIACKLGYSVVEVKVTWGHDDRSHICYLKDGTKMLEEMAIIRFNAVAGRYNHAIAAMKDTSGLVTAHVPHAANSELRPLPQE